MSGVPLRSPSYRTLRVSAGFSTYRVEVAVYPARMPAHVGADSPRHMDPGSPASVRILRVYRGAREVTRDIDDCLLAHLHREVSAELGIVSGPRGGERQGVMEFAR